MECPWRLLVFVSLFLSSGAEARPTAEAAVVAPASANPSDYLVHPGDVLRVFVWKEPDLSGDVQVRVDGKITVLLVGDVVASERTPMQLAATLEEKLARFVEAPAVTVVVAQASSARYFILGQVAKPGMYPLTTKTTLVQALAMAGGFATFAKTDEILIIHERTESSDTERVDYDKIKKGDTRKNYEIQWGDTILVP